MREGIEAAVKGQRGVGDDDVAHPPGYWKLMGLVMDQFDGFCQVWDVYGVVSSVWGVGMGVEGMTALGSSSCAPLTVSPVQFPP